jgi:hypothetical protein
MKKGDKKKQHKALKRRMQSKAIRSQQRAVSLIHPVLRHLNQARNYPIENCWVQEGWQDSGLAVVCVARRQSNGNIIFGVYLVDCYCLGVKDAYFNGEIPPAEFQREFLPKIFSSAGTPVNISADLAHEIVYGGVEYARQFGFRPHADFRRAQLVLDPPELHPRTGAVTFGKDGKPFYVSGPHDDAEAIMRQLARVTGEGNFHFMTRLEELPEDLFVEDLDEEENDWDDE